MFTAQQFVIAWIEFAFTNTLLLAIAQAITLRLRQPVDRVNFITMSLIVSVSIPLLLGIGNAPSVKLGWLPEESRLESITEVEVPPAHSDSVMPIESMANTDPSNTTPLNNTRSHTIPSNTTGMMDSQPTLAVSAEHHAGSVPEATAIDSVPATASTPALPNSPAPRPSQLRFSTWMMLAVAIAMSHCLMLAWYCGQWFLGFIQLHTIARRSTSADQLVQLAWQHLTGNKLMSARLLVSHDIAAPLVFGSLHPTVLIPASIANGDRQRLEFCLAHEWSHIKCHDLMKWQLVNLCQCLFWYQPLYWSLRCELRVCQDLIADDLAAGNNIDDASRVEYSELLLSLARQVQSRPSPSRQTTVAMGIYGRTSALSRRIKLLLTSDQALHSQSRRTFTWLTGVALVLLATLVGSIRFSSAQTKPPLASNPNAATTDPLVDEQKNSTETQSNATQASGDAPDGDPTAIVQEKKSTASNEDVKIVRGKVVNTSGDAVAGARLWLPLRYRPQLTAQATADDSGNFELKIPKDWISPELTENEWEIWAHAPGLGIQTQNVHQLTRDNVKGDCLLTLPPASKTSFRVLDPDGEPLPNVLVKPINYKTVTGYSLVPKEMESLVAVYTDEQGIATLSAIESNLLFKIELVHSKFGRQTRRVDSDTEKANREVRLRPVASIQGKLVGDNPEWLKKVTVAFTTDNPEFKEACGLAETVTDEHGHFAVPVIASGGPLRTYVAIDKNLPVRPVLSQDQFLTSGDTEEIEIPLVSAPRVRGKVVAKDTGKPVANAELVIQYGKYHESDKAVTDSNGQYEGRCLPGNVRVHIIYLPDGYVQLGTPWADGYKVPDDVTEFDIPVIEVVGSHEITGTLIDSKDKPLPNMDVLAVDGNRRYGFGKSDADGRFKMRVPDGVHTSIEVYIEKWGQYKTELVNREPLMVRYFDYAKERKAKAEQTQKAHVTLVGKAMMAGKPVGKVSISAHRGEPVADGANAGMRYVQVDETLTDTSGRYRLTGLKAGDSYYLIIKPPFPAKDPSFRFQSPYFAKLPQDAKGEFSLPDINLLKSTQTISGFVVDPDGKPVRDASVSAQLRNGQSLTHSDRSQAPPWTKTDAKGRFSIKELPEEPLTIMAYIANPEGGRIRFPAKVNVELNQQNVRILLDPTLLEEDLR